MNRGRGRGGEAQESPEVARLSRGGAARAAHSSPTADLQSGPRIRRAGRGVKTKESGMRRFYRAELPRHSGRREGGRAGTG